MRGLSLATVLAMVTLSGCGGGANSTGPGSVTHDNPSSQASPEPEKGSAMMPVKDCPVTDPLKERDSPPPSPMPAGPDAWVGTGPLWADLSQIQGKTATTYRVRWKAFIPGEPVVEVRRLDATGQGTSKVTADEPSVWTGEVTVAAGGCWVVTATIGDASVGFVVRS